MNWPAGRNRSAYAARDHMRLIDFSWIKEYSVEDLGNTRLLFLQLIFVIKASETEFE